MRPSQAGAGVLVLRPSMSDPVSTCRNLPRDPPPAGEVIGRRMTSAKSIVHVSKQTRAVSGQSKTVVRLRGVSGVGFRGSAGETTRGVY